MARRIELALVPSALALQGPLLAYLSRQSTLGSVLLTLASLAAAELSVLLLVLPPVAPAFRRRVVGLSLGSLAMLVGWLVDAGRQPLIGAGVCLCGCADSPAGLGLLLHPTWVQGCMVLACAASAWESPGQGSLHRARYAVRTVVNSLGMLVGMAAAGWTLGRLHTFVEPVAGLLASYAVMAAGMAFGSWACEAASHRVATILPVGRSIFPRAWARPSVARRVVNP
jgi:hypothetical protein